MCIYTCIYIYEMKWDESFNCEMNDVGAIKKQKKKKMEWA